MARLTVAAALGYLGGSFPSADIASHLAKQGQSDLRAHGTGNPGAANAMAVLGPGWGYGVLVADVAKGSLACRIGRAVAGDAGAHAGGVGAVVGHCFPWHAGFRGGKGVAASAGQCLATFPAYFPIDLAVAGLTATRRWKQRAYVATVVASITWAAAGVLWWRRGWPNLWGPKPTAALPLAAAASGSVIVYKFASATKASP
jgi:acyl phosphate:glycerol-3-phosphate acyltransferase